MWRSELSFLSILLLLFKIRKCCDFSVRPSNEMWNLFVERWRTWTKRQEKIFWGGGVRENRAPLPRLLCRVVLVNLVRELRELLASSLAKENEGKKKSSCRVREEEEEESAGIDLRLGRPQSQRRWTS
jgi:hypothetical protein